MEHQPARHAGPAHPSVRQYFAVRRHRGGPRHAAIEGVWALTRALDAGVPVHEVFVCDELVRGDDTTRALARAAGRDAAVHRVGRRLMERMTSRDGPDGVTAVVEVLEWDLESISVGTGGRVLIVDRAELPGNIGTLIRCADGAGASAIVLTDARAWPLHPQSIKASMGTIFAMPLVEASASDAIAWCRRAGLRIVAADPAAPVSYRACDLRGPVAIVVGSERLGLSDAWRQAADVLVRIPMLGRADSLNVGHAAALLLYEALHHAQS